MGDSGALSHQSYHNVLACDLQPGDAIAVTGRKIVDVERLDTAERVLVRFEGRDGPVSFGLRQRVAIFDG